MSLTVMPRFASTRETPDWANPGSLLEGGGDFGFGWSTGWGGGLLGALPQGARAIVGTILQQARGAPSRVVIAPPTPTPPETPNSVPVEDEVAHDWGHLGREFLGAVAGQAFGAPAAYNPTIPFITPPIAAAPSVMETLIGTTDCPSGLDGQPWTGAAPPKGYKVVNYCGQAVLRKIRRRRRRRILSASDAADIATIVGLVGKGQMASALINRRP